MEFSNLFLPNFGAQYNTGFDNTWFGVLFLNVILQVLIFAWYYFRTLPNPTALKRFWIVFLANNVVLGVFMQPLFASLMRSNHYVDEATPFMDVFIKSLLPGSIDSLIISIVIVSVYVFLGHKVENNLKAMRKYPFAI